MLLSSCPTLRTTTPGDPGCSEQRTQGTRFPHRKGCGFTLASSLTRAEGYLCRSALLYGTFKGRTHGDGFELRSLLDLRKPQNVPGLLGTFRTSFGSAENLQWTKMTRANQRPSLYPLLESLSWEPVTCVECLKCGDHIRCGSSGLQGSFSRVPS